MKSQPLKSWYAIRALEGAAEVSIYDEIGAYGVSAKAFLAELSALPPGQAVTLRINSPGGSVFDAVAIFNGLKRHGGAVTVWVDGIAASAASYVAMAGDEVVMPENAFLMIHDPSGLVMGTAADMRAMAEALDKIKSSLVAGYAGKSGAEPADVADLMARETWLDAREAVDLGFADRIAQPVRMAAHFDMSRFSNPPERVIEAMAEGGDQEGDQGGGTGQTTGDPAPDPASDPAPNPAPDPDRISAEATARAMAHARAVVDLCALAGMPAMAGRFLEAGADIDTVRAALIEARADAQVPIDGLHPQPGRITDARPWREVIARTFRLPN